MFSVRIIQFQFQRTRINKKKSHLGLSQATQDSVGIFSVSINTMSI